MSQKQACAAPIESRRRRNSAYAWQVSYPNVVDPLQPSEGE